MKFLRLGVSLAILALVGMLYYSNLLLEREVKVMRAEMRSLQLRRISVPSSKRVHIDPALPNLLHETDFYTETLPQMLGPDFTPSGEMRVADLGKPANWHPFSGWAPVSSAWSHCVPSLAGLDPGSYERFTPELAIKIEERGEGEFWVHLREGVFWQPLEQRHFPSGPELAPHFLQHHPVTAHDFKFYFDAVMNPYVSGGAALAMRQFFVDVEELRVVDDLTFVVRWRRPRYTVRQRTAALKPLPCWLYRYFADGTPIIDTDDYRDNSIWAQNFAQHWAVNVVPSCGPWIFDGIGSFRRNSDHYNPLAALCERETVTYRESPDGIWQDFKAGQSDMVETRYIGDKIAELPDLKISVERCDYLERSFRYLGWNNQRAPFNSAKVRRAMTLAIDRRRIIDGIVGGLGIETTGSFFPGGASYDSSIEPYPYDPVQARRLLKEEGVEGFSFRLLYYVKSTQGRLTCDYIATALREVGVDCHPVGLDTADFAAAVEGKDFDAIYLAWMLGTPPDEPRQIWHSDGASLKGSSNHIGFVNAEADAIIEKLDFEKDLDERQKLYHRFHRILHEEQPYTFLYVPKAVLLYRDHVHNVFIPSERLPGAEVAEPMSNLFYIQ